MGTGEIGRPLYELIAGVYKTLPVDPVHFPKNELAKCEFLNVCIPGNLDNFKEIVLNAIKVSGPRYVVIHSTTIPGTVEEIQKHTEVPVAHTPVQGKHAGNQMKKDMLRYPKYIGVSEDLKAGQMKEFVEYFERVGFSNVLLVMGTKNSEWQKVLATSLFGWQIAWAQEVERICDEYGLDFDAVTDTYKYIEDIIPPHYSGVIGGHCVMPNIELISKIHKSPALDFIKYSNELKRKRDES
jgi:UDP-N-acetyl-D-mannosaminuronate dehydrogenase